MRWIRHKGHSIQVPDTMQKVERDGYSKTPKSQDAIKKTTTFNWNASLIDEEAVEGFHHDGSIEDEEGGSGSR